MKNEIALGIIAGLLLGSGLVAPHAAQKAPERPAIASRTSELALPTPSASEKPLSYYQKLGKRDLFKPAIEPAPPRPETVIPKFPVAEPAWTPPTEGWTYAGYFSMDGVMTAIIHEPASGQAAFLREGEAFRDGTVVSVTTDRVELSFDQGTEVLYKSREYNTVPLSGEPTRSAPPQGGYRGRPNRPAAGAAASRNLRQPAEPQQAASDSSGVSDRASAHERAARLRSEWAERRRRLLEERNASQPEVVQAQQDEEASSADEAEPLPENEEQPDPEYQEE